MKERSWDRWLNATVGKPSFGRLQPRRKPQVMKTQLPAWLTLFAAVLGGCAQINWERAVYDGVRVNTENEARRIGPAALPDPQLPAYKDYEEERGRLRRAQ